MENAPVVGACRGCGGRPAEFHLGGDGPLCDRCFDDRISAATGLPRLPDTPAPVVITDGDGRRRVMRYRIWRAPTGVCVELREVDAAPGEGFEFGVLGDDEAEVEALAAAVRTEAETGIGRCYLEPGPGGAGWRLAADEVAGRLEWDPKGGPYRVVVDGRSLSWQELGEALEAYEGWRFRLLIDDPSTDLRSGPPPDSTTEPT